MRISPVSVAASAVGLMSSLGDVVHGFAPPSSFSSSSLGVITTATTSPSSSLYLASVPRRRAASPTSTTRLLMGWGPEPIWSAARVTRNEQACPSGSCVSLYVDVDDGSDFVIPGQYVQVRPAGGAFCVARLSCFLCLFVDRPID